MGIPIVMAFLLWSIPQAQASHYVGGDVYYTCISPNTYQITFQLYRDCDGIAMPSSLSVSFNAPNCGASMPNVTFSPGAQFGVEITPVCPAQLSQTTCNSASGAIQGTQIYEYTATVTLPSACDIWQFGWTSNARNNNISNIPAGSFFVGGQINNANGICNNSARFTTLPTPYICANQPFVFNHGAIDADGDTLIYSLAPPLITSWANPNTTWYGGTSATQPFVTLGTDTLIFSSNTGQMNVTPNGAQTVVLSVYVYEIRNGDTISVVMRDMQVVVLSNCTNNGVTSTPPLVSGGGTFDNGTFVVCQCDTLNFQVSVSDPDGDTLSLDPIQSNIGQVFGPANVTIFPFYPIPNRRDTMDLYVQIRTCTTDVSTGALSPVNSPGVYGFTLVATDNACPLPLPAYLGFNVIIPGVVVVVSDTAICAGIAQDIQLGVQTYSPGGGTVAGSYQWSQVSGPTIVFDSINSATPIISVPQSTTVGSSIVLEVQFITAPDPVTGSFCVTSNRVVIRLLDLPLSLTVFASETSLCQNGLPNAVQLSTGVSGPNISLGAGTYTWSATPSSRIADLNNLTINNPMGSIAGSPGDSATYIVSYSYGACVGTDSIMLRFREGITTASAMPDTICSGDTVVLSAVYSPVSDLFSIGNCGLNSNQTCVDPPVDIQVGTSSGITASYPFYGFYDDARTHIIYTAAELTAAGVQPGLIHELAFNITAKNSTQPYNGFTVKIGCTNLSSFTNTNFVNTAGLSTVYTGVYNSFVGWNAFAFSTPYEWDGVSNLLVEICFDNSSWTSSDATQTSNSGGTLTLYRNQDGVVGCVIPTGYLTADRPIIRFSNCTLPSPLNYQWSPSFSISNDTIQSPSAWPAGNTTYYVSVSEGGCAMVDSVNVVIRTDIPVPTVNCGMPENYPTEILFNWGGSPGANGWEYSLDSGATWVFAPLSVDSVLLTGFTQGDCHQLQVRATGAPGACLVNAAAIESCCTSPCVNPTQINSIASTDLSCFQSQDGTITYLGTLGDRGPDYTFTLFNAVTGAFEQGPFTTPNSLTFSGLTIGSYYVVGTDAFGCMATSDTVTLTQPNVLEAALAETTLTNCWNTADGTARVTQVGGTAPYTYLWDANTGVQTMETAIGLDAGIYQVTVTDANGCEDIVTGIHVLHPFSQQPSILLNMTNSTGCPGTGTASIQSVQSLQGDPNPGNPNSLSYVWYDVNGAVLATDVLSVSNLIAGVYSISITDTSGCAHVDSFIVSGAAVTINATQLRNADCNLDNGIINIEPTGDSNGYTYAWSNGEVTEDLSGLAGGTYSVTVSGISGCQDSATFHITGGGIAATVVGIEDRVCLGGTTGYININIDTAGYSQGIVSYIWSNGATTQNIANLSAGTYGVTVTYNGDTTCIVNPAGIIHEPFVPFELEVDPIDCGSVEATPSGGWPDPTTGYNYLYEWSNGGTTASLTGLASGMHYVTVTDDMGCEVSDSVRVGFPVIDPFVFLQGITDTTIVQGSTEIPLSAGPNTPESGVTYTWQPANLLQNANLAITKMHNDSPLGCHTLTVTANSGICTVEDTVRVCFVTFAGFPNAFTPNGDGNNDMFRPIPHPLEGIEIDEFKVYNRWGQVVFDAAGDRTKAVEGWDGKLGGVLQPSDAYIYVFSYRKPGETEWTLLRGETTLLR